MVLAFNDNMSTFTPRRSARGQIFTPSPAPSAVIQPKNVTFAWTSAPLRASDSIPPSLDPDGVRTYYNSFTRITSHTNRSSQLLTPGKRPKAGKGDEEARFSIGDGVLVKVEGGTDGVGVLIRLWEEPEPEDEEDPESEEEQDEVDENEAVDKEEKGKGTRMMGEVHWVFRRQDLPGIMKNLSVKDVSYLAFGSSQLNCRTRFCWPHRPFDP